MNLATRPSSAAPPILLVEDNPVDIDLTCRAFARDPLAGPVHVARDGETVLDFMQRWDKGEPPPGLILLDINLPGVNGFEVLRQLKRHPVHRSIPVVMLSSSAEQRDLLDAYSLGVNSYIVKPVDFDRFVETTGQIGRYWFELNQPPI